MTAAPATESAAAAIRGMSSQHDASARDIPYIASLMRSNYEAVGFLPIPRLETYVSTGQLWVERENGDPCGYLVFGGWPTLRVYQCCIQFDAQRRAHASSLITQLSDLGESRNCTELSLWCADDLEANEFWRASGFVFAGKRQGGARRGRMHRHWVRSLTPKSQLSLGLVP